METAPMKHILTLSTALACLSMWLTAQAPQQSAPPGPSPQQQMMGYFAGDWTLTGTMKISPNTPAAAFTGSEHGEWVPGSFFLEAHSKTKGPLGDVRATRVMEYNPEKQVYTYNVYNSLGEHQLALGEVHGNIWTWTAEEKLNDVITKGRYTITITSPTTYEFKSEVATPTGAWSSVMEGKAVRSQPRGQ